MNEIARPEVFFREVHPEISKGQIVLERIIGRSKRHSRVLPSDAEKIARLSCNVPDLSYSVASFSGMPLLTNFESTRCLFLQSRRSPDTKDKVFNALQNRGFPLPTAVTSDGELLTYYWMLEKALTRREFYKVYLFQLALYHCVSEAKPTRESLDISALVPLVGTINSKTGEHVGVVAHTGVILKNLVAEEMLLHSHRASSLECLQRHSQAILELQALLHDRVLNPVHSCDDWLLFFGASLSHFCSQKQLEKELQAIAVSLVGLEWAKIEEEYSSLITGIAATAGEDYIRYRGQHFSTNDPDWFRCIYGKLDVTYEEVDRLGFSVIVENEDHISKSRFDLTSIYPVGEMNFVPIERLVFTKVA